MTLFFLPFLWQILLFQSQLPSPTLVQCSGMEGGWLGSVQTHTTESVVSQVFLPSHTSIDQMWVLPQAAVQGKKEITCSSVVSSMGYGRISAPMPGVPAPLLLLSLWCLWGCFSRVFSSLLRATQRFSPVLKYIFPRELSTEGWSLP